MEGLLVARIGNVVAGSSVRLMTATTCYRTGRTVPAGTVGTVGSSKNGNRTLTVGDEQEHEISSSTPIVRI